MKVPRLEHPERYAGLYVVDFGDTTGVGYTAEEVAMLLESEAYAHVQVYRMHRACPDGTLELKGVPRERFLAEAGLLFYRPEMPPARADYEALRRLAEAAPPPCRARLFLGVLPSQVRLPYVVGLAYPAEYDEDVSRWMLEADVSIGEVADGGIGRLETIQRQARIVDSAQLVAAAGRRSRSRREVLASVGRAIQRGA